MLGRQHEAQRGIRTRQARCVCAARGHPSARTGLRKMPPSVESTTEARSRALSDLARSFRAGFARAADLPLPPLVLKRFPYGNRFSTRGGACRRHPLAPAIKDRPGTTKPCERQAERPAKYFSQRHRGEAPVDVRCAAGNVRCGECDRQPVLPVPLKLLVLMKLSGERGRNRTFNLVIKSHRDSGFPSLQPSIT